MKAELGEVGGKARLGAGDAEIRRHRKSEPAADRGAMDGCDDRLLSAKNAHGLDVKMRDRAKPRGRIGFRARLLLLPRRIVEVRAGTERLALCGQHRRADFDVAVEFLERIRDLVDQRDVEEIQRWPPDLDQADMPDLLDADVCKLAHG
jgi:hypothetical protein